MPRKKIDPPPFCECCHVQPRTMKHYEKAEHVAKKAVIDLEKAGNYRLGFGYACLQKMAPELVFVAPIYAHNGEVVEGKWAPWWAVALSQRTGYRLRARKRWLDYFRQDEEARRALEVAVRGFKVKILQYLADLGLIEEGDKKPAGEYAGTQDWHEERGNVSSPVEDDSQL